MSHVDWDLLADHLGGALAGTPEDARVAQLVATDAGWAQAASQLSQALHAVASDLRTVPPAAPMPDDVAARLDAALRAAPPSPAPDMAPRPPVPAQPAAAAPAPARPVDGRPPGRSGPRRRRRARWGAGLAVAAGVAVFAAIGLGPQGLGGQLGASDDSADAPAVAGADRDSAAEEAEAGDEAPLAGEGDRPPMVASGRDYRPESPELRNADALPEAEMAPVAPKAQEDQSGDGAIVGSVPGELEHLWDNPGPCLAEIQAHHQPTTIEIQLIDFARFQDSPALVVWITGEGLERVLVVGPECGTSAAGLDERYRAEVE